MTTTAATDPGSRIQLAVHRAVRRDTDRLAAALAGGDEIPVDAVQAYWAVTAAQLHHHHELEDTVIWALLGERLGERVALLLARNAEEHQVMAAAMDEFDAALVEIATSPAAARQALERMQGAIETHLAHEEADVLPLGAEAFTMEDIAFFRAEDAKTNSPDAFLPWLLDAAPEDDLTFFTSAMPAPVRARLDSDWMPRRQMAVEGLRRSVAATS
ncbi:MAG: hemerythrin domain-containing protein [Acidobacteriota bacterium]|nr:hemerythrin domain-containing protein [Acidobacteriota bacterium]